MSISSRVVSGAALLVALLIAGLIIGSLINIVTHAPRTAEADAVDGAGAGETAAPTDIVVGRADGEVVGAAPSSSATGQSITAPTATSTPTATPTATPTSTPEPTKEPSDGDDHHGSDGFSAEVVVCESVKGGHCRGETDSISTKDRTIWLMVRFENASGGDRIGMTLSGPGATRDGGSYAVKGGDGRAWSQVSGRLAAGDYTITATRNGEVVAESTLHVG